MTVETNPISIPVPVRHRKQAPEWSVHRAVREARGFLAEPIAAKRATHLAVAAGYSGVALLAGVLAAVVTR